MESEERELLLAAYLGNEMSASDKQMIEKLFGQDPAFKAEAEEMAAMWGSLDNLAKAANPSDGMSDGFYEMLDREAVLSSPVKVHAFKRAWLQAAAAVFIGAATFTAGRYTVSPSVTQIVKYQTVYVKQPAAAPQVVQQIAATTQPATVNKHVPLKPVQDNSRLARQLRSIYVSERIGAVMTITRKGNLDADDLKTLEMALREDPNANVRLTILDALRPLAARQSVQTVLTNCLAKQDDQLIQSAIVDLLIDNKSKQAIPQMMALLDDRKTNTMTQTKIRAGIEGFLTETKKDGYAETGRAGATTLN